MRAWSNQVGFLWSKSTLSLSEEGSSENKQEKMRKEGRMINPFIPLSIHKKRTMKNTIVLFFRNIPKKEHHQNTRMHVPVKPNGIEYKAFGLRIMFSHPVYVLRQDHALMQPADWVRAILVCFFFLVSLFVQLRLVAAFSFLLFRYLYFSSHSLLPHGYRTVVRLTRLLLVFASLSGSLCSNEIALLHTRGNK